MDVNRVPMITLRLRQLNAVYGKNFQLLADDRSASGDSVMFAISPIDPGHLGYVFVSETSKNVNDPEWDLIHISDCSNWMLSAKAALFTFFSVKDDINTIIFEMEVHFSGLVMLPSEDMRDIVTSSNQVFFRMGTVLYAPPNYLVHDTSPNILRNPTNRLSPKASYDFDTLQQFIVNDEAARTQQEQFTLLRNSVCLLEQYLNKTLLYSEERELKRAEISVLKERLESLRTSIRESRSRLQSLTDCRSKVETGFDTVTQATKIVTEQYDAVKRLIRKRRTRLVAVKKALSLRARHLIREVAELFGAELARMGPNYSIDLSNSTDNKQHLLSNKAASLPGPLCAHGQSADTDAESGRGHVNKQNTEAVGDGFISRLWDTLQPMSTSDMDTELAAVGLGVVAQMMCLLSAILNHPIRHPFDLSEGYSRATVLDRISSDSSDTVQVFPLYCPRGSFIPAYRHAIGLLNRNLAALRSLVGLPTPSERATMWNLKNLIQHCLSAD